MHQQHNELDPRHNLTPHMPRVLDRRVFYKGQTILEQGSQGYRAFYIEKGLVEVVIRDGHHEVRVATLGAGEICGEMALIEHDERSATVRALEDTTVAVINEHDLERKFSSIEDDMVLALIHVLIRRVRDSNMGQVRQYRSLIEFQDRMAGLIDRAANGIEERKRRQFRDEVTPLLDQIEALLDSYRAKKN